MQALEQNQCEIVFLVDDQLLQEVVAVHCRHLDGLVHVQRAAGRQLIEERHRRLVAFAFAADRRRDRRHVRGESFQHLNAGRFRLGFHGGRVNLARGKHIRYQVQAASFASDGSYCLIKTGISGNNEAAAKNMRNVSGGKMQNIPSGIITKNAKQTKLLT